MSKCSFCLKKAKDCKKWEDGNWGGKIWRGKLIMDKLGPSGIGWESPTLNWCNKCYSNKESLLWEKKMDEIRQWDKEELAREALAKMHREKKVIDFMDNMKDAIELLKMKRSVSSAPTTITHKNKRRKKRGRVKKNNKSNNKKRKKKRKTYKRSRNKRSNTN